MNTTTCWHCGQDYPDSEMMPLPEEGELCPRCAGKVLTLGGNERAHGILLNGEFVALLDYCGDAPLELVDFAPADVQEKYGRLFIEAPAMLECLERVMDFEQRLKTCPIDGGAALAQSIRATVKRARGEQ